MPRTLLLFAFSLLCAFHARAQAAKAVYAELGGPGVASFNYDMRFSNREDGLGGRVGVGGFAVGDFSAVFVPVGVNYLIGKNHRDYFELGGGATFVNIGERDAYSSDNVFHGTFGHLNFGYRMQPARGGFLFRAAIVPIFGHGVFIPYYAGISFGYKF